MVATTGSQLLPYQQGTDRPCDSPAVWCDFVSVVSNRLDVYDAAIARVSPSIPMAKVTRSTVFQIPAANFNNVQWEAVVFDTDNMVNFAESNQLVIPQRHGRYAAVAYAETVSSGVADNTISVTIARGLGSNSFDNETRDGGGGATDDLYCVVQDAVFDVASGDREPFTMTVAFTGTGGPLTIGRCELTVFWLSDADGL